MRYIKVLKLLLPLLWCYTTAFAQQTTINHQHIQEDLEEILSDIANNYPYLAEKKVDLDCIRAQYTKRISTIKTEEETVLFFEYLLDEFYDSHLILNTNRASSYRLYAPIYISLKANKPILTSVWQHQLLHFPPHLLGAELRSINGQSIAEAVQQFPTLCQDKNDPVVREWVINKLIAGRYNEPRKLNFQQANGEQILVDLDTLQWKQETDLLTHHRLDDIGIIRIKNTLGRDELVHAFDAALDSLWDTKGLIIDIRNTVDGGDSYEARGIMSRFVATPKPYQKHAYMATSTGNPSIERSWLELVSPRGEQYTKPLVVLVGRWTGSMGEGLAIGLEGIGRAQVVGTEMERLAGEMTGFSFKHQPFGYRLSFAKLFHVNGTLREKYVPPHYVQQTTLAKDEVLEKGLKLLKQE
ncbi:MAG: S41 family peptidase [Bacteroidota bacterium]